MNLKIFTCPLGKYISLCFFRGCQTQTWITLLIRISPQIRPSTTPTWTPLRRNSSPITMRRRQVLPAAAKKTRSAETGPASWTFCCRVSVLPSVSGMCGGFRINAIRTEEVIRTISILCQIFLCIMIPFWDWL